jgi:hypothetical protein
MFTYHHYLTTSNAGTTGSATQRYVASSDLSGNSTFSTKTSHTTHTWAYDGNSYTEYSETYGDSPNAHKYSTLLPAGARSESNVTKSVSWSITYVSFPTSGGTASASSSSSSTATVPPGQDLGSPGTFLTEFRQTTSDTTYVITGQTTASSVHSVTFAYALASSLASLLSATTSRVRTTATYTSTQSGTTTGQIYAGEHMGSLSSFRFFVTRGQQYISPSTYLKPVAIGFLATGTALQANPAVSFSHGSHSFDSLCQVLTSIFYNTSVGISITSSYTSSSTFNVAGTDTEIKTSNFTVNETESYSHSTATITQHVVTGTTFAEQNTTFSFLASGKAFANSLLSEGGNFNSSYVTFWTQGSSGPVYGSFRLSPPVWTANGNSINFYNGQDNPNVWAGYYANSFGSVPIIFTKPKTDSYWRVSRDFATLCWSYLSSSWRLFATLSQASTSEVVVSYTEQGDVISYDENDEPVYETITVQESWTASSRHSSGSTTTLEISTSGTSLATPTTTTSRIGNAYWSPGDFANTEALLGPIVPWTAHGLNQYTTSLLSKAAWYSYANSTQPSTVSAAWSSGASTQSGSFAMGSGAGFVTYANSALSRHVPIPAKLYTASGTASGKMADFGGNRFVTNANYSLGNAKFNQLARSEFVEVNSRTFLAAVATAK